MSFISKLIKIPGKNSFDDLNENEVAFMIDAFFFEEGNENFDKLALNDFLHADLSKKNLVDIQKKLNANMFIDVGKGKWPDINENFLLELANQLKEN